MRRKHAVPDPKAYSHAIPDDRHGRANDGGTNLRLPQLLFRPDVRLLGWPGEWSGVGSPGGGATHDTRQTPAPPHPITPRHAPKAGVIDGCDYGGNLLADYYGCFCGGCECDGNQPTPVPTVSAAPTPEIVGSMTLTMFDSYGDGWNGAYYTWCVAAATPLSLHQSHSPLQPDSGLCPTPAARCPRAALTLIVAVASSHPKRHPGTKATAL